MSSSEADLPKKSDVVVTAQIIWGLYLQAGGATFNLYSGNLAGKSLYAVSVYGDRTRDVDEVDFSVEMVEAFIQANVDLLVQPNNSIGVWLDASRVYLDVSITVEDRQRALALAREHGEQAICHLSNLTVEYTDSE